MIFESNIKQKSPSGLVQTTAEIMSPSNNVFSGVQKIEKGIKHNIECIRYFFIKTSFGAY